MSLKNINQSLNEILGSIREFKERAKDLEILIDEFILNNSRPALMPKVSILSSFDESLTSLVNEDEWPQCINPTLVCDSYEDKLERAEHIISLLMDFDFKDKSFLDFGCGEGHIVTKLASKAKSVLGYDREIQSSECWRQEELFTTSLDKVKNNTYDVILLYDVLDHCENPLEVLNTVYSLLNNNGIVYVRCHPWCSRHGAHQYKILNKAYIHLIFSSEELASIGFKDDAVQRVIKPLSTYQYLFDRSNFQVKKFDKEVCFVENFFLKNKQIKERIMKTLGITEWTQFQIEQVFLDYELTKNLSD